jgi:hypothetical protein
MIEAAVDQDIRCHRPPAGKIFRRVKRRCRHEGWALNGVEEQAVLTAAGEYVRALRRRTRQPRILDGFR